MRAALNSDLRRRLGVRRFWIPNAQQPASSSSNGKSSVPPPEAPGGRSTTLADAEARGWVAIEEMHARVNVSVTGPLEWAVSASVTLPRVGRALPDQPSPTAPPLAVQDLAFTELQVRVVVPPDTTVVGEADRVTLNGG